MRTIRVTGKGQIKVKPDITRITMTLTGVFKEYGETLRHSSEDTEALEDVLSAFGFERSDLKTLSFHVDTEYESYRDKNNDYKRRFVGYRFNHALKVEFESDNDRLGKILYALANGKVRPEFRISYQGKRVDLTCDQVGHKLDSKKSIQKVAEDAGESKTQVQRYIRLTELLPEVQEKVDSKEIAFSPAVELSYLTRDEQKQFLDAMDYSQNTPSLSQAQRLKKLSREGKCTQEAMRSIMSEEKKEEQERITLSSDTLRKYFPRSYTPLQMQQTIIKLLEQWQKKQQRRNER